MSAVLAQPVETPPTTEPAVPSRWYAADLNFTRCIPSRSPADRIRMIQDHGSNSRTTDLPNGGVEVSEQTSDAQEQVWTYFRTEQQCTSALPRSQAIPSRYE